MFRKKIFGLPAWLLLIIALVIFRKRIPIVDKTFESIKGMLKGAGSQSPKV